VDTHKLQLKIFATPDSARAIEPEALIPVFHRWIKEHVLPELLIDVANYGHVPEGPGVVLIGHACDYFMDEGEGRLGLLHSRKRCAPPPADRLIDLARRTLHATMLLERDPVLAGTLRFAPSELVFRINDRLAAPNDPATFASRKAEIEGLARRLFDGAFELAPVGGPKDLFSVRLRGSGPTSLAALLDRAGGPPGADASLVA
jgi:hypothetical protein